MENQRTLRSQQTDLHSYNTYLTIFAINVAHRFLDDDLSQIPDDQIRTVAKFCVVCSPIARESWDEYQSEQFQRQQPLNPRQTRIAS